MESRYLYNDDVDHLLARIDHIDTTAVQLWYLQDYQNSTRYVLDQTGTVVDSLRYDGYGNIDTGSELDPSMRSDYAWTGRELDVETGLQYNRARWYDGTTGRWISEDPMGFDAGDSNLYRYVNNRPTMATDPNGLHPNQTGAKNPEQVVKIIRDLEQKFEKDNGFAPTAQEGLLLFTMDQLRDVDGGFNHYYVFSKKSGEWLDMRHFANSALWASMHNNDAQLKTKRFTEAVVSGFITEHNQDFLNRNWLLRALKPGSAGSAWTQEDLFSNMQGALFGMSMRDQHPKIAGIPIKAQRNGELLSEMMVKYFQQVGAVPKTDAPNWIRLPVSKVEWQVINRDDILRMQTSGKKNLIDAGYGGEIPIDEW